MHRVSAYIVSRSVRCSPTVSQSGRSRVPLRCSILSAAKYLLVSLACNVHFATSQFTLPNFPYACVCAFMYAREQSIKTASLSITLDRWPRLWIRRHFSFTYSLPHRVLSFYPPSNPSSVSPSTVWSFNSTSSASLSLGYLNHSIYSICQLP